MSLRSNSPSSIVWILVPVVMLGQLSMDLYLPALDALRDALGASPNQLQLTLSAFVVSLGATQFAIGELSRRLGRGRAIRLALGAFTLATAGCAATSSIALFIACRVVQGAAAAICVSLSYAAIADQARDRADNLRGTTLLTVAVTAAPLAGPVIGSQALQLSGSWRAVFLLLLAVSVATTLFFARQPAARFGLGDQDARRPSREVYARILGASRFWRHALLCAIGTTINFCFFSFLPGILLGTYGLSQNEFSIAFCCCGVLEIAGSLLAPAAGRRLGEASRTRLACACALLGGLAVAMAATLAEPVVPMTAAFALVMFGTGMLIAPNFAAALYGFREHADEASTICSVQQFMIAAGVASFATLMQWQSASALGLLIAAVAALAAVIACVPAADGVEPDEGAMVGAEQTVASGER
ncbi:MFS transporter [Burkholderia sp. A1]|uniref:MFS transporter n=1 Tax=Burkholderia sp. A1 TaxID=148446 RepID=UPI0004689D81|nr:MFS transporter [Burkholderia sp. A1]